MPRLSTLLWAAASVALLVQLLYVLFPASSSTSASALLLLSSSTPQEIPDNLTQPLLPSPSERKWKQIFQTKFHEFSVKKTKTKQMMTEFLHWVAANREKGIPPWRPGRAKPIVCDGRSIYSGYYSIPSTQMVRKNEMKMKKKVNDWSTVVPLIGATYVYNTSEEGAEAKYVQNMQESRFGISMRKAGWQSPRTLELFAAGTIPYYCDIALSPKEGSVSNLPREVLQAVLDWEGLDVTCFPIKKFSRRINHSIFNFTLYTIIAEMLRQYSEESLTAPYIARYMLSITSLTTVPKKVLLIWVASEYYPSYMMPLFVIGLKELGVTVVDYPREWSISIDFKPTKSKIQFREVVNELCPNIPVLFHIERNGIEKDISVIPEETEVPVEQRGRYVQSCVYRGEREARNDFLYVDTENKFVVGVHDVVRSRSRSATPDLGF